MNLPFRKQSTTVTTPIIPEMNGPVPQPMDSRPRILWGRLAGLIVGGVLVVLLLFMGGKWVVHTVSHKTTKTPTVSTSTKARNKATEQQPSSGTPKAPATSSSPSQSSSNSAALSTQPSQASSSQPTNLTNTGPGSTAAIFALVTIAGAASHQLLLRRKLQ